MEFQVQMKDVVPLFDEFRFRHPLNWTVRERENWVVIGPNGAGKTMLTDIFQGRIARKEGTIEVSQGNMYGSVKSMEFRDIYSLMDCRNVYYQQRWNASEIEEVPLAGDFFSALPADRVERYIRCFGVSESLSKRIVSLSSGELRKLLIIRNLIEEPRILILDNPFIGLDVSSRESLSEMLCRMSEINGLQTILVLSDINDIPVWTDWILPVSNKSCGAPVSRETFMRDRTLQTRLFPEIEENGTIELPKQEMSANADFEVALRMESICVRYGDSVILNRLDWEVKQGEKWALLGENGSGKSTLLSLVCGDNPQAYANAIILFDRVRGTGESIWDIKRRIGYLSPDLHTYYLKDIPALRVVVSGFYDSVGLFVNSSEEQREKAYEWMEVLHIAHLADRSFVKLSFGEQRLVLLARALVKNPPLLILDEPLHGLDAGKKKRAKSVIEAFCRQPDKTLIYVTHYRNEIPDCVTQYKILKKRK